MLLITITNWKRKASVVFRLLLFLLLIGLIIPQFLSFIASGLADREDQSDLMRVEQKAEEKPSQDATLLEKIQQIYYGKEPGSSGN